MTEIAGYFAPNLVLFLDTEERDEALRQLVEAAARADRVPNKEAFYEAVVAREKMVSTGIGMGIAIPHAKLAIFKDFFIAVGISKKGIPWDALDNAPVKIIFLVGGPDDRQTDYLQILSRLTAALKEEERRKEMLAAEDAESIVELFHGW